jgi:hypothetical protein
MRQDIERLLDIAARTRPYASFFEWPDKERKELGVVEELISGLKSRGGLSLSNLRPHRPDPPDCVCSTENGETVAIEVSEVVCESAVSANARGEKVYRLWRPGELTSVVSARSRRRTARHSTAARSLPLSFAFLLTNRR